MIDIEKNYANFIRYIKSYITRDGVDDLIKWLDESDAKVAPASTKYHLSCEGGLIQHSINVFMNMINQMNVRYGDNCPYSKEQIAIVSLLHDISKVNFYKKIYRNVQNQETGVWEKVPSYCVKDESERLLFASHEENSLYIVSKFLKLGYEEELAIRYHMGNKDSVDSFAQSTTFNAYKVSDLALLLHIADTISMVDEGNCDNAKAHYDLSKMSIVVKGDEDVISNSKESIGATEEEVPF